MDTEPPEGDDLQRMLVSMKQTVLERATPRTTRRRGRSGIAAGVVALLALGTATGAVALTLTQQDRPVAAPVQTVEPEPAPSATTPTSAPITGRPTPRPVPTPTRPAVATIPTSCPALVPAEDSARLFGDREPLEVVPAHEAPLTEAGVTRLDCRWGASDGPWPGMSISVGTGTPEELAAGEAQMFEGWEPTCDETDRARTCRASSTDEDGVFARTRYTRDGVWIEVIQGNFPTNGLLDAVVGEIWGD